MAGSTYEQFSTPSAFTRVNPGIALQWILNNVPCFKGTVPVEWTRAVYREASWWKIDFFTLQVALKMADKHGYVFAEEPVHAAKAGETP